MNLAPKHPRRAPLAVVALLTAGVVPVAAHPAAAAPVGPLTPAAAVARADRAIAADPAAVRAAAGEAYAPYRSTVDADGTVHVRYTRTFRGLRVRGGDFVVHVTSSGALRGVSVGLVTPLAPGTVPAVGAAAASTTAQARFVGKIASVGTPELIVDAGSGPGRLAWETVVAGTAADGATPSRLHVVTDATTGAYLGATDEIETVTGTGYAVNSGVVPVDTTRANFTYHLLDPSHGGNGVCDMNHSAQCTGFSDADNVWGNGTNADPQSAAVDAHYGAATAYDYFRVVHGRNGVFGDGAGVPSRVHYGNRYADAFWDGAQMTYGDGDGVRPFVSLDIAGHEMTHGITENLIPGGLADGESAGLNESTSDIFGSMVEFYADNSADPGDYQLGERVTGNGLPIRYMYRPSLDGRSDDCWNINTKNRNGHHSAGVGNHFFVILAESSTAYGTFSCGPQQVTGLGRTTAEKIWYRALAVYFTSTTKYVDNANPANTARAYTLHAAADLYGTCSTQYKTVQRAWSAVNVSGNDAACPSTLTRVGSGLSIDSCNVYGNWGYNAGNWGVWWCSQVVTSNPYGYELWAYVY